GPDAILQPGVALQNHVRVASFAILSQCIVQSNVEVGAAAQLRRTYVDRGASIGPGVFVEGGRGSVVGADAVMEGYSKLAPGGSVGRSARVSMGRVVSGVPDHGHAV
ncbi:MAG: GlgC family sugar phosphate nucleotidyltransferase, partial [Thermoplasmatota archaeon]